MAGKQAKAKELKIKDKVQLIRKSENGKSQRQLAAEYGVGKSQVQRILKRKAEWMTAFEENTNDDRKRLKLEDTQFEREIDSLTFEWFTRARGLSLPLSGPLIQEKAKEFAEAQNKPDFKASNGWLDKFKHRHNINAAVICGESASVDANQVSAWKEKLPEILKGYNPRDVFNMDESGIFYRALPDKTLRVKGEECKGGKKSKDRLTASFCVNMQGEFEKTLVIGKSAKPRCFKNVDHMPVTWQFNKKAWMNTGVFLAWVNDFNNRMRRQHRNVLLLLDNAPSHPRGLQLSNVKMVYLPANTTSVLQPLDQGIIRAIKQRYRRRLLQKVLAKMEKKEDIAKINQCVSVLDAINWIAASVKEVSPTTVKKCFAKAGMTDDCLANDDDFEDEDNIPLASLITQVQKTFELNSESMDDYLQCDENLDTCNNDDTNLVQSVLDDFNGSASDNDMKETESTTSTELALKTTKQALDYVEELKSFVLNKDATHLLPVLYKLEEGMCALSAAKQTTMENFFK